MTDYDALCERLQEWKSDPLCREAHDAIAALKADNAKLREALRDARHVISWENKHVKQTTGHTDGGFDDALHDIDAALAPAPAPEGEPCPRES